MQCNVFNERRSAYFYKSNITTTAACVIYRFPSLARRLAVIFDAAIILVNSVASSSSGCTLAASIRSPSIISSIQ